jgi:basic amino acid/polyamine antiporter, APA family
MSGSRQSESSQSPIRSLSVFSAIVVGISAMVGTGVFVAWQPAYELAGSSLFIALAIAASIAALNAISNARMARRFPESGGGYVYGRECIHPIAGQIAGWVFLVGKAASASAAALAIGVYVSPGNEKFTAVLAIAIILFINLLGIRYSVGAMTVLISIVLLVLLSLSAVAGFSESTPSVAGQASSWELLSTNYFAAAGILFVAFAGYARIAVLGSEVKNPRRAIPTAIAASLAIVVVLYFIIAFVLLEYPNSLLTSTPLESVASLTGYPVFLVVVAAVLAAGSALFALMAGLGRMIYSMSVGGHVPSHVGILSGRRAVPRRADLVIATAIVGITLVGSIGVNLAVSAIFVLTYYVVVHASSWTHEAPGRSAVRDGKSFVLTRLVPGVGILANIAVVVALLTAIGGLTTVAN